MRTKYLVFASILAGIPVTCVPVRAEPAVETCFAAPTQKAPEGSRWRYQTDPTTNRKCYFLRVDADKVRSVTTKPERQRSPITLPATETTAGQPGVGQPMPSGRAAPTMRERVEDTVISGRWPDPTKATGAGVGNPGTEAGSTVEVPGNVSDQSPADAAVSGSDPSTIDYRLVLALAAGALVVAGIIGRMTFRRVSALAVRRGDRSARRDITAMLAQSQEMLSSIFARAAATVPQRFHHTTMTTATALDDVTIAPQHDSGGDRQEHSPASLDTGEEIDVLLQQLEKLGERPAA